MSNSDWRDSEQESGKPRPAIQGRTELEDSLLAVRREDQAQQKRRSAVLSQALKARSVDSDPQGKKFLADRAKAVAARREENARIDQDSESVDAPVSLLDVWEDVARKSNETPPQHSFRRSGLRWISVAIFVCVAAFLVWKFARHLPF